MGNSLTWESEMSETRKRGKWLKVRGREESGLRERGCERGERRDRWGEGGVRGGRNDRRMKDRGEGGEQEEKM